MSAETRQMAQPTKPFDVTSRLVFSIAVPMTLAFLTTPLLGVVDVAVVGRLGDAALLGGLAVASIMFDLLYGTFNFLRSATTGLVAQALGRGDKEEESAIFWRSAILAILIGVALIVLQPAILSAGLFLMGASSGVAAAATIYFSIRIFSAPAAFINYAVLGYFLGRGEGLLGLGFQLVLYGVNIILSIYLGLTLEWGVAGVAIATVIAEYCAAALALMVLKFRKDGLLNMLDLTVFDRKAFKKLMALNSDIMIRSFALVGAFAWFTRQGGQFGDVTLAANAILMNFLFVSGYFLDGFATAAEQLAGRAIGANYKPAFVKAVKLTVLWGFILAGGLYLTFIFLGPWIIDLMTTESNVRAVAKQYYIWASLLALAGLLAFEMDGIFIGATWSSDMRNMMLLSLLIYLISSLFLVRTHGNLGLWWALNIFLVARGLSLSLILPARIKTRFG